MLTPNLSWHWMKWPSRCGMTTGSSPICKSRSRMRVLLRPLLGLLFLKLRIAQSNWVVPIFNGKSLDGWNGDKNLWQVSNGVMVGTGPKQPKFRSYLSTNKTYKDFVPELVKSLSGDSGVVFRAKKNAKEGLQVLTEAGRPVISWTSSASTNCLVSLMTGCGKRLRTR